MSQDDCRARVFKALADPVSLRLLVHALNTGECDSNIGEQLGLTRSVVMSSLHKLVRAELLIRSRIGRRDVYCVSDAGAVERLLQAGTVLARHRSAD